MMRKPRMKKRILFLLELLLHRLFLCGFCVGVSFLSLSFKKKSCPQASRPPQSPGGAASGTLPNVHYPGSAQAVTHKVELHVHEGKTHGDARVEHTAVALSCVFLSLWISKKGGVMVALNPLTNQLKACMKISHTHAKRFKRGIHHTCGYQPRQQTQTSHQTSNQTIRHSQTMGPNQATQT